MSSSYRAAAFAAVALSVFHVSSAQTVSHQALLRVSTQDDIAQAHRRCEAHREEARLEEHRREERMYDAHLQDEHLYNQHLNDERRRDQAALAR